MARPDDTTPTEPTEPPAAPGGTYGQRDVSAAARRSEVRETPNVGPDEPGEGSMPAAGKPRQG